MLEPGLRAEWALEGRHSSQQGQVGALEWRAALWMPLHPWELSPMCMTKSGKEPVAALALCPSWSGSRGFHVNLHAKHSCTVDYKVWCNGKITAGGQAGRPVLRGGGRLFSFQRRSRCLVLGAQKSWFKVFSCLLQNCK